MPIFERNIQILQQPHLSGALCRRTVARDGDKIQGHRPRHRAGQVGEKDERAFQHRHEMQRLAVRVVAIDVCGQLEDAGVNLVGGE